MGLVRPGAVTMTAKKLRGVPPLAQAMDKRRALPVVGGRDAPKIRRRIAARPPGFGSYPARLPIHALATPDSTTRKRRAPHDLACRPLDQGNLS
jgi:hypothetical protein